MTTIRRRARAVIAAVVAMAVTLMSSGPAAAAHEPGGRGLAAPGAQLLDAGAIETDWAALVPTAESLAAVAVDLPADPMQSIERLVETIWDADAFAAVSATGELLRLAGLPLVSADGPVVALPSANVIVNAPVLVEFLPSLTDAARSGVMYPPDQVAELLEFVGFATEAPADQFVPGMLAAWGKGYAGSGTSTGSGATDDIAEVRAAGAAARALAKPRGELLIPDRVTGIDPITTVLLLAHVAGELAADVVVVPAASGFRAPAAGAWQGNAGKSGCEELKSDSRAQEEAMSAVKERAKQQTRDAAGTAAQRFWGDAGGQATDRAGDAYDKLSDAISIVLLLLGAKLDLAADKGETHFRHRPGDRAGDVTLTATASFSSALANRHLGCWSLIGIDVPPNGALEGYTVNWRMSTTPQAFQAFSDSRDKFANGDVTGRDGTSTVSVYPRTELSPPRDGETQPELTIQAAVIAGLDKNDFPWKFTDLLDVATAGGFGGAAVKALYGLLMDLIKRGALPTMSITIPVKYHGQMPFAMVGAMQATSSFVSISVDFRADLYSCTGPLGPWEGTAGSGGNVSIRHTGSAPPLEGAGQADYPMRFELAKTGQPQRFLVADAVGIEVELDAGAVQRVLNPSVVRDLYDAMRGTPVVVGSGTWTLDGEVVARKLGGASTMSWAAGTERFDVISRPSDDRCGGSSYWADQRFDRTERG